MNLIVKNKCQDNVNQTLGIYLSVVFQLEEDLVIRGGLNIKITAAVGVNFDRKQTCVGVHVDVNLDAVK